MKYTVENSELGRIEYDENFWTGKKLIVIDGKPLLKQGKNLYQYNDGENVKTVNLMGSFFSGVKVSCEGVTVEVLRPLKWYEIALSVSIFALIMVWGNNPYLCSIIPVVGGALGGVVSAVGVCLYLVFVRKEKPLWQKLVYWAGCLVGTFLVCALLAMALLMMLM